MVPCPHCHQPSEDEPVCTACQKPIPQRKRFRVSLIELTLAVLGVGFLAFVLIPNFLQSQGRGQGIACKSNLKNISTALEMYSTDNRGRYPRSLMRLTPNYLKVIPECPSAGTDTYSASYQVSVEPDHYSFCCMGQYHGGFGISTANYPQFNSRQGLVERP